MNVEERIPWWAKIGQKVESVDSTGNEQDWSVLEKEKFRVIIQQVKEACMSVLVPMRVKVHVSEIVANSWKMDVGTGHFMSNIGR